MNEYCGATTSSPSAQKVCTNRSMISFDPAPTRICAASTPWRAASLVRSANEPPSGYRFADASAFCAAAMPSGDGPYGFSFDASLIAPPGPHDTPSSRSSSSIGLPGSYGAILAIAGSTSSSLSLPTSLLLRGPGARIRAEHLDEFAARLERAERALDRRLAGVPVDVDEED